MADAFIGLLEDAAGELPEEASAPASADDPSRYSTPSLERIDPAIQHERDRRALALKLDERKEYPDDPALARDIENTRRRVGAAGPAQLGVRLASFDPEGEGYDYESARAAGLQPDSTGHWPSRDPRTGLLLKGRKHPTWSKTEEGERAAGYTISQGDGGRYYSRPQAAGEEASARASTDPRERVRAAVARGLERRAAAPAGRAREPEVLGFLEDRPIEAPSPAAEKQEVPGALGRAADVGVSLAAGVGSLIELGGELGRLATGDDNVVRQFGEDVRAYWDGRKSADLKAREQARRAKIDAAEGELAKGLTAIAATVGDPALFASFVAEQVPQFIPGMALGRAAVGVAQAARLGTTAQRALGVGGAIGAGAALQGADVGGDAYERLLRLPDEVWVQHPDYAARVGAGEDPARVKADLALKEARGATGLAAAISVLSQAIPGGTTIERLLAGVGGRAGGFVRGAIKGLVGEALQEGTEEGGGQVAQNLAVRNVDPSQRLTEHVGEATGLGVVLGGALGGAAGVVTAPASGTPERKPQRGEGVPIEAILGPQPGAPQTPAGGAEAAVGRIAEGMFPVPTQLAPGEPTVQGVRDEVVKRLDEIEGRQKELAAQITAARAEDADEMTRLRAAEAKVEFRQLERERRQRVRELGGEETVREIREGPRPISGALPAPQEAAPAAPPAAPGVPHGTSLPAGDAAIGLIEPDETAAPTSQATGAAQGEPAPAAPGAIKRSTEPVKRTRSEAAVARWLADSKVDTSRDALLAAIAKLGGLDSEEVESTWGIQSRDVPPSGVFGLPAVRKTGGRQPGRSIDEMVEVLTEAGYLTPDQHGKGDVAEFERLFGDAIRGKAHYTAQGFERQAALEADQRAQEEPTLDDEALAILAEDEDGVAALTEDERAAVEALLASARETMTPEEVERLVERAALETENEPAGAYIEVLELELRSAFDEADRRRTEGARRPAGEEPGEGETDRRPSARAPPRAAPPEGERAPAPQPASPQELELQPTTRDQLAAEAERLRRLEEERKRREAAPPAEDFRLTGSERPADLAAAAGQAGLFERQEPATPAPTLQATPSQEGAGAPAAAGPRLADEGWDFVTTFPHPDLDAAAEAGVDFEPAGETSLEALIAAWHGDLLDEWRGMRNALAGIEDQLKNPRLGAKRKQALQQERSRLLQTLDSYAEQYETLFGRPAARAFIEHANRQRDEAAPAPTPAEKLRQKTRKETPKQRAKRAADEKAEREQEAEAARWRAERKKINERQHQAAIAQVDEWEKRLDEAPEPLRPLLRAGYAAVRGDEPTEFIQGFDARPAEVSEAAAVAAWHWTVAAYRAGEAGITADVSDGRVHFRIETPAGNLSLGGWAHRNTNGISADLVLNEPRDGVPFSALRVIPFEWVAGSFWYRQREDKRAPKTPMQRATLKVGGPEPKENKTTPTAHGALMIDGKPHVVFRRGVVGDLIITGQRLVPEAEWTSEEIYDNYDALVKHWDREDQERSDAEDRNETPPPARNTRGSYYGLRVRYKGEPYVLGEEVMLVPARPQNPATEAETREELARLHKAEWSESWKELHPKDIALENRGGVPVVPQAPREDGEAGPFALGGMAAVRLNGRVQLESVGEFVLQAWEGEGPLPSGEPNIGPQPEAPGAAPARTKTGKPAAPKKKQIAAEVERLAEKEAEAKARADLDAALGDLGDILGKGARKNITPEQEQKLLPVLTRVFDAAFRLGHIKFKQAARFVLDTIRAKLGAETADQITIDHLQGAYIAMAGKYRERGAEPARAVTAVESIEEIKESTDDRQDRQGLPGEERAGQEPEQAEPQQDTGRGAPASGGTLQAARPEETRPVSDYDKVPGPPFTTPGTRIEWNDAPTWLEGWRTLKERNRKPSSQGYKNIVAHWGMLAAKIDWIIPAIDAEALRGIRKAIDEHHGGLQKGRGTVREIIINAVNNDLAKLEGKVGRGREVFQVYPSTEGTEIHLVKNSRGYAVMMKDTDSGQYLPTLRQFTGEDALSKAVEYAESIQKKAAPDGEADAAAATSPASDRPYPTGPQMEAGNYKKERRQLHGLDITIENPKGSVRTNIDVAKLRALVAEGGPLYDGPAEKPIKVAIRNITEDGNAAEAKRALNAVLKNLSEKWIRDELRAALPDPWWMVTIPVDYGYIRRTQGADGDQVDVFVGPNPETPEAFIINQRKPGTLEFDEHKVMLGFTSARAAERAYRESFEGDFAKEVFEQITGPYSPEQLRERLPTLRKARPVVEPATNLEPLPEVIGSIIPAEAADVPGPGPDVEPDRQGGEGGSPLGAGQADLFGTPAGAAPVSGAAGGGARGRGARPDADPGLPDGGAAPDGASSDLGVRREDGQFEPPDGAAGDGQRGRGAEPGGEGVPAPLDARDEEARSDAQALRSHLDERLARQRAVGQFLPKWSDEADIRRTLPLLLPEQQDDVLFAEQRLIERGGDGVLFTNGTGTGKTFTSLGVARRFAAAGYDSILITVPSDKVAQDWIAAGKLIGLDIRALKDTKDNGTRGPVVTTYANFAQNESLVGRDWHLIIPDEAHYLSSDMKGASTNALEMLRALTYHPRGIARRAALALARAEPKLAADMAALRERRGSRGYVFTDADRALTAAYTEKLAALEAPIRALAHAEERKLGAVPRVLMLSATPFAYRKSVDYAEGYLFRYSEDRTKNPHESSSGYNSPSPYEQFFIQHFGYRMRYNKLTEPDADVDTELLEQNFNQWLKDQGALSGRKLEVEADYDRAFVMVEDEIGRKIDEGIAWIDEHMQPLADVVRKQFDYFSRMFLLEAIKARHAVPYIRQHLALGRKVVVFHDFNKGGAFHPFKIRAVPPGQAAVRKPDGTQEFVTYSELVKRFEQARPDLLKLDFEQFASPLTTLAQAFPEALFFNGLESRKDRRKAVHTFNLDGAGADVIVVQSDAGREGISLHDTTGEHQRVIVNLGMPARPVAATQIEGRIYRVGQRSDAIFRYFATGTNWERWAFAGKIAERSGTAENLALGLEARGLRQAFIDAFEDAQPRPPSPEEGKGGKSYDRALAKQGQLSPFEKAKTYYFAQQKKTSRDKAREGIDYFATPEPLGLKMVEWAGIRSGESVLEPSAGHGAIARNFPDDVRITMVEPSDELASRAALVKVGARMVRGRFEDLDVGANKFDAIVMNPPFGVGGKTAMEHLEKAAKHLRDGGRIVALVPRGPAADKRWEAFYEDSEYAKGLYAVAEFHLPNVTFARAGTQVAARIVVLERQSDETRAARLRQQSTRDLTDVESIKDFFDRIEQLTVPERIEVPAEAAAAAGPEAASFDLSEYTGEGKTWFLAKPTKYIGDAFRAVSDLARQHDGFYGRFKRAFMFREQAARDRFVAAAAPLIAPPRAQQPEPAYAGGREVHPAVAAARSRAERSTAPAVDRDVLATAPVPGVPSGEAVLGTLTEHVQRGEFASGVEHVRTPEDAAHVLAELRKSPEERFIALVTDGEDRPIAAIHHTKGGPTQTQVYPGLVVGAVHQMPNAARVWLAHNHPSAGPVVSEADRIITNMIEALLRDTGVELAGNVIVAGTEGVAFGRGQEDRRFKIPPKARKFRVPIVERVFKRVRPLGPLVVTDPQSARQAANLFSRGRDGLLFLDPAHRPVAWLPMLPEEMRRLRAGRVGAGASRILRLADRTNAGVMLAVFNGPVDTEAMENLQRMARNTYSLKMLDAIDLTDPSGSAAERGFLNSVIEGPFFSRARGALGRSLGVSRTREIAASFTAAFPNAPKVNVLGSWTEAPPALKSQMESAAALGEIHFGALWNGEIWLFADGLASDLEVVRTLLHEATHFGLRGIFGRNLDALLLDLYLSNRRLRRAAQRRMAADAELTRERAVEEVLADVGGAAIEPSVWDRIVAAVARLLRRAFGETIRFTNAEVRELVERALRFTREGAPALDLVAPAVFNRAPTVEVMAQALAAVGDQRFSRMVESHIERVRARLGRPLTPEEEAMSVEAAARSIVGGDAPPARFSRDETAPRRARGIPEGADRLVSVYSGTFKMRQHPHYEKAKSGDAAAAYHVARDLVPSKSIIEAHRAFGSRVTYIAVDAMERGGHNALPHAIAARYAKLTSAKLSIAEIIQTNRVLHTGADAMSRMARRAKFSGPVTPGARYVIVDDVVTLGGTFAELADYIQANGGEVAGFVALVNATRGSTMRPSTAQLAELTKRGLDDPIRQLFGIDPHALTRPEAGYLASFRGPDTLRARAHAAGVGSDLFGPRLADEPREAARFSRTRGEVTLDQVLAPSGDFRPLEALAKGLFTVTGVAPATRWAWDRLLTKVGAFVPETVKAGVVDKYGLDERYRERRALTFAAIRGGYRKGQRFIDALAGITLAESRILHEWMTNPEARTAELEARLNPDQLARLKEMRTHIDAMGAEAVRLGDLSNETYERYRGAYLHRSYLKHEVEATEGEKRARARAIRILGDQYRMKGLKHETGIGQVLSTLPKEWGLRVKERGVEAAFLGKKFIRFERYAPRGEGTLPLEGMPERAGRGKLREVVYWPADEPVPSRFGEWYREEVWEARWTKDDRIVMWRDFTRDELEDMGRIEEVRYAVARTLQKMVHDVEVSRLFEWIADTHAKPESKLPPGAVKVEAREGLVRAYGRDEWVRVPGATIGDTGGVRRYGKLADLWVPGPIWNDVRQIRSSRFGPEWFATMLRMWKISKTALSPAVHMNNVMANFVMADWHDVGARDIWDALQVMLSPKERAHQEIIERFEDAGGTQGMYVLSELQRDQLRPLLEELRATVERAGDTPATQAIAAQAVALLSEGRLTDAWDRMKGLPPAKLAKAVGTFLMDLYHNEDQVFRLAAFIRAKREGKSDLEAGKAARQSFLDYDINAPWINLARGTLFPFVSFTYRALPMMIETAFKKPWKLAKLAFVAGGLNALGYALSGGDEDEERAMLPDEKRGRVLGFIVPKLLRMPWNARGTDPTFLDIRRFVPVGDVLDIEQTHSALPLPPPLLPGGPLGTLFELVLNKVGFTGQPIVKETDTPAETAEKVFKHVYRSFVPNLPGVPWTWSTDKIARGLTPGATDGLGRETDVASALASAVGVKFDTWPPDVAGTRAAIEYRRNRDEIEDNIRRAARQAARKGMTAEEFGEVKRRELEKLRALNERLAKRLRAVRTVQGQAR